MNTNLPPRMRARRQKSGRVFYYFDTGSKPRKEIPLGSDYVLAVQQWAKLNTCAPPVMKYLSESSLPLVLVPPKSFASMGRE